jgi:hypothetical protein
MKKLIICLSLTSLAFNAFSQKEKEVRPVIKNNPSSNGSVGINNPPPPPPPPPSYYIPACATTNPAWLLGGNKMSAIVPSGDVFGGGQALGTCDAYDLILQAGGVQSLWLKPSGRLGINKPNPGAALDIAALDPTTGALSIYSGGGGTNGVFYVAYDGSTFIHTYNAYYPNTPLNSPFKVTCSNTNIPSMFEVTGTGQIGIGSSTPTGMLDIHTSGTIGGLNILNGTNNLFSVGSDGSTTISSSSTTANTVLNVLGSKATVVPASFANGNGYKTFLMTGAVGAGSYNGLVKQNDNALIWDNGTNGNGVSNGLVLAAWNGKGIRIDGPTGNLGIGNASPAAQLDINATANTTGAIKVEGTGGNTVFTLGIDGSTLINSSNSTTNIPLTITGVNATNVVASFAKTTGSAYKIFFTTGAGATNYNGIVQANDNAIIWDNATNGATVSNGLVLAAWSGTGGLRIDATGAANITCNSSTISPLKITNTTLGTTINAQTAFEVTAGGLVHIGTTRPGTPYNTAALTVGGTIVAKEIWVLDQPTGGWADYVFKPAYKLMPLNEVENYIHQNQHLPNVPSAKEVDSKGQNLGDLQVKQMEKIEELTLYMIEINKNMTALNKKVETLQKENKELKQQLAK